MGKHFSACECVELAVNIEKNGKDFYEGLSGIAETDEAAKVFNEGAVAMPADDEQGEETSSRFSDNIKEITQQAELRFDLEKDLREAVSREDYEQAAKIRDRLHTLTGE